jgi:hypothetical protein
MKKQKKTAEPDPGDGQEVSTSAARRSTAERSFVVGWTVAAGPVCPPDPNTFYEWDELRWVRLLSGDRRKRSG